MTECVSLTIDDVTGQAVPESGTGRMECSVADGCKPHSRYLQSMCPLYVICTVKKELLSPVQRIRCERHTSAGRV